MARPRITAPLLLGTLGALAIFIASAVAGWIIIGDLEARNTNSGDAEILANIAEINKLSGMLASAASVPTTARMTPESIAETRSATANHEAQLTESLSDLEGRGYDDRVGRIRQQVDLLTANVSRIQEERPDTVGGDPCRRAQLGATAFFHQPETAPGNRFQPGQPVLLRDDGQE